MHSPFSDSSVSSRFVSMRDKKSMSAIAVIVNDPREALRQSNPGQVGLGSSRPESTRPGQLGRVKSAL